MPACEVIMWACEVEHGACKVERGACDVERRACKDIGMRGRSRHADLLCHAFLRENTTNADGAPGGFQGNFSTSFCKWCRPWKPSTLTPSPLSKPGSPSLPGT